MSQTKTAHNLPKLRPFILDCLRFMGANKWLFVRLGALYVAVMYVMVGGFSQLDFVHIKQTVQQAFGGGSTAVVDAGSLFVNAITGTLNQSSTDLQQFMGDIFSFIFWLAAVILVKMRLKKSDVTMRDALYAAGGPIVPASILLVVIAVQLLPASIGLYVFSVAQSGGAVQSGWVVALLGALAGLLCALSLYWLVRSLLALMIAVQQPATYPVTALREATNIVKGRRWRVLGRIAMLAIMILAAWLVLLVPVLLIDGWLNVAWLPLVPVAVEIIGTFTLLLSAVYMYKLYRAIA